MSKIRKFTVAIDFDGTLITNAWPEEGYDMVGGSQTIHWLLANGARVIVWTCRVEQECPPGTPHSHLAFVRDWIVAHGLQPYLGSSLLINQNFPDVIESFGNIDTRKVFAHVYVDDRNLGGFSGWGAAHLLLAEMLNEFQERQAALGS